MFIDPYLANVTIFAGNFAPRSWMFCQGQLLSIAEYSALYALLGTTYGGDGQNTFALPDMRSRVVVHPGQGPGLSMYYLGEMAATESTTLLSINMPAHNHSLVSYTIAKGLAASNGGGTANAPSTSNVPAQSAATNNYYASSVSGNPLGISVSMSTTPIAGSNQPVPIISPYLAMNYIIAVEGIFPSRN